MSIVLTPLDWLTMFGHFLSLSLMAVGGAIATAPDMHRYLVEQQHWLTESQFSASMALAQAAPGPNLLFIPLMGWNVGINSAGGVAAGTAAWGWGLLGVFTSLVGMLLPSTTLALAAARWSHQNRDRLGVRAFKSGMAPVVAKASTRSTRSGQLADSESACIPPIDPPTPACSRSIPSASSKAIWPRTMSRMVMTGKRMPHGLPSLAALAGPVDPMQLPSTLAQMTKKRSVSIGNPGPTIRSHQPGLPVMGCGLATC